MYSFCIKAYNPTHTHTHTHTHMHMHIDPAPTIITQQHNMVFTAQENTQVTLLCEVSHDERATLEFSWTKNGVPLVMDNRVMFVDQTVSGSVSIDGVVESDAGNYVCRVTTTYQGLSGPTVSTDQTNFTVTGELVCVCVCVCECV